MGKYIENPNDEEIELLTNLFVEWCSNANSSVLNHLFEIIESHESAKIQELALKTIEDYYPTEDIEDVVNLWITHPLPQLHPLIKKLVYDKKLSKPLSSVVFLMLDQIQDLIDLDPEFHYLDQYLESLDPLLGSLVFEKVKQLKDPEFGFHWQNKIKFDKSEKSINDLLRIRDYDQIWESILDYPLPFICELLKILNREKWRPVDPSEDEIYELLTEFLGINGWSSVEKIKWQVVSIEEQGKFRPIKLNEIADHELILHISSEVVNRPDKIKKMDFQSRGRFNLTDSEIGLNIYQEMIRKSELDGLLHIPIYSSNGIELAEFIIPAPSISHFQMDEDGLYFTVRNRKGYYSVDVDALAAFLLPVSRHSEGINEMIPTMLERSSGHEKLVLTGLNLLSSLHKGREFTIWDQKKIEDWDDIETPDYNRCLCNLAIDIGNQTSKLVIVVGGNCDHEPKEWKIPSLIHYKSKDDYIIGEEVIKKNLINSSKTFRNFKGALIKENYGHIRIQNSIITAQKAYEDYLHKLIEFVKKSIDYEIDGIALSYSSLFQTSMESWVRDFLAEEGFKRIDLLDELSSAVIGMYRLNNHRGNILLIDVGATQMGAIIASLPSAKSRKQKEDARMREEPAEAPTIISKQSVPFGSYSINELLLERINEEKLKLDNSNIIESVKLDLSNNLTSTVSIGGKEMILSLIESDNGKISILDSFENSAFLKIFRLLIRNVIVKADYRGIDKKGINLIILKGQGAKWPLFKEQINKIFPDVEVINDDDTCLTAKGVGLILNGQKLKFHLNREYVLKIANNGIVDYFPILHRGDKIHGMQKFFDIRPQANFDRMVLDCWALEPIFSTKEEILPLRDKEVINYHRFDYAKFHLDRVFRQLIPLRNDALLKVQISSRGSLYFEIEDGENIHKIRTNITIF